MLKGLQENENVLDTDWVSKLYVIDVLSVDDVLCVHGVWCPCFLCLMCNFLKEAHLFRG